MGRGERMGRRKKTKMGAWVEKKPERGRGERVRRVWKGGGFGWK